MKRIEDDNFPHGNSDDNFEEWLTDFYSGYMYDPDGKQLEKDMKKSPRKFLSELDDLEEYWQFMSEREREKTVSRIIQWGNRISLEAGTRIARLLDTYK